MKKEKAIFKFNSGMGALLCSKCSVIIKTGNQMTQKELKALKGKIYLKPQYCEKCKFDIMMTSKLRKYLIV